MRVQSLVCFSILFHVSFAASAIQSVANAESSSSSTLFSSVFGGIKLIFTLDTTLCNPLSACDILVGSQSCTNRTENGNQVTCYTPSLGYEGNMSFSVNNSGQIYSYTGNPSQIQYLWLNTPRVTWISPCVFVYGGVGQSFMVQGYKVGVDLDYFSVGGINSQSFTESSAQIDLNMSNFPAPGFYSPVLRNKVSYGYAGFGPSANINSQNGASTQIAILPNIQNISITNVNNRKQTLTISGEGFSSVVSANTVQIENLNCTVISSGSNQIVCELDKPGQIRKIGGGDLFVGGAGLKLTTWNNRNDTEISSICRNLDSPYLQPLLTSNYDYEGFLLVSEIYPLLGWAENYYLNRSWGFFTPDISGNFTFESTQDDCVRMSFGNPYDSLSLSTIGIATSASQWKIYDASPDQTFQTLNLQAGTPYPIEIIYTQISGGNYFSVASNRTAVSPDEANQGNSFNVSLIANLIPENWMIVLNQTANTNIQYSWVLQVPTSSSNNEAISLNTQMSADLVSSTIQSDLSDYNTAVQTTITGTVWTIDIQFYVSRSTNQSLFITDTSGNPINSTIPYNFTVSQISALQAPAGNFTVQMIYPNSTLVGSFQLQYYASVSDWSNGFLSAGVYITPLIVIISCSKGACQWKIDLIDPSQTWTLNIVNGLNCSCGPVTFSVNEILNNQQYAMKPITFKNLRTSHSDPQVVVTTNGMTGACISLDCNYEFSDPNILPVIMESYLDVNTGFMQIYLQNDIDFVGMPVNVSFAGFQCISLQWTAGNMSCQLNTTTPVVIPSGGPYNLSISATQFQFSFLNGSIPDTAMITNATVSPLVSAASPSSEGLFNYTISGFGFLNGMTVSIGNTSCTIISLNYNTIICQSSISYPYQQITVNVGNTTLVDTELITKYTLVMSVVPPFIPVNMSFELSISVGSFLDFSVPGVYLQIQDVNNPTNVLNMVPVTFSSTSQTIISSAVALTAASNYIILVYHPTYGLVNSPTTTDMPLNILAYTCLEGLDLLLANMSCVDCSANSAQYYQNYFDIGTGMVVDIPSTMSFALCQLKQVIQAGQLTSEDSSNIFYSILLNSSLDPLYSHFDQGLEFIYTPTGNLKPSLVDYSIQSVMSYIVSSSTANTMVEFKLQSYTESGPNGTLTLSFQNWNTNLTQKYLIIPTNVSIVLLDSPATIAATDGLASAITIGNGVNVAMQTSIVALSILPAVTGGFSISAMLLIGFLAEVDLYKYINVPFPEDFVTFCQQIGVSALPNMFAKMDVLNHGNNPNSTIGKFKFWGVSATLLDNSYTSIFKELVTLGIILLLNILVLIFKRNQKLRSTFFKIRTLFMWNVFLSYFLGDFSELQLNSMIQMRENYVSSAYSDFSLALAIIIVITYSGLFPYMVYILNRRRSHQEKTRNNYMANERENNTTAPQVNKQIESWIEVPDSIKIIAEDFQERNRFTRNFMLVMLLQLILLIFLVFFLQDYGLAQSIIYTILTLVYVSLIAWQRPFKSKVQTGVLLLNQTTKIVMGIMAILLGANEKSQFISPILISPIGYFLIALIMIVVLINLLISIAMIIVAIYKMIKVLKSACKKTALSPRNNDENLVIRREDDSAVEQSQLQVFNDSIDNLEDNSKSPKSQHIEKEMLKEEMTIHRYPKKSTLDSSQRDVNSNNSSNQSLFEKNSGDSRDAHLEPQRSYIPSLNSSNNLITHNFNSLNEFNSKTRSTVEKRNPIELEDSSTSAAETKNEDSFPRNYERPKRRKIDGIHEK